MHHLVAEARLKELYPQSYDALGEAERRTIVDHPDDIQDLLRSFFDGTWKMVADAVGHDVVFNAGEAHEANDDEPMRGLERLVAMNVQLVLAMTVPEPDLHDLVQYNFLAMAAERKCAEMRERIMAR